MKFDMVRYDSMIEQSAKKMSFSLSPLFLCRYYLIRDIKKITSSYSFKGKILDVGCGQKPYESFFKDAGSYQGIDFEQYSLNRDFKGGHPDFFFTNEYADDFTLPFKDQEFDHCVGFQVIEHHPKPEKMLSEMIRIIKPSGYVVLTFPHMYPLHEIPHDYFRFSEYAMRSMCDSVNAECLEIIREGGLFSVISMLFNESLTDWMNRQKFFMKAIAVAAYPFFLAGEYLAFVLDLIIPSRIAVLNYAVVIQKK